MQKWCQTISHQQFFFPPSAPALKFHRASSRESTKCCCIWSWCGRPADMCDYIALSKWSSSLWTVMAYLFSPRGCWEMIWRWRFGPTPSQPLFLCSSGREKITVWHQGRQGRTSNLFRPARRHFQRNAQKHIRLEWKLFHLKVLRTI